jgi:Putative DNA-binding domain
VQTLAELQTRVARAVTGGDVEPIALALVGGIDPTKRLDIHRRHYETSLTGALCDKFPACAWLLGSGLVRSAARAYVRVSPPLRPCIAEYGRDFPQFLANHCGPATPPYVASFAALEWAVGQASITIDFAPLSWAELVRAGAERLMDSPLVVQPGLRYLRSSWPVDELMTSYLSGATNAERARPHSDTFIEVLGVRGSLRVTRLDHTTFVFRAELAAGSTIAAAAGVALELDAAFDPGEALRRLVQEGLITNTESKS